MTNEEFTPDYRRIVDAARNRRPGRLPLYDHIVCPEIMEKILGVELPIRIQWLDTSNQDIWQSLALTSIGGLLSSTVLIIVMLPALYYASVRVGWGLRRLGLWIASRLPAGERTAARV